MYRTNWGALLTALAVIGVIAFCAMVGMINAPTIGQVMSKALTPGLLPPTATGLPTPTGIPCDLADKAGVEAGGKFIDDTGIPWRCDNGYKTIMVTAFPALTPTPTISPKDLGYCLMPDPDGYGKKDEWVYRGIKVDDLSNFECDKNGTGEWIDP